MKLRIGRSVLAALAISAASFSTLRAAEPVKEQKVEGYAEYRVESDLVVDGQRIRLAPGAKFKGKDVGSYAAVPLGYEVEAKGVHQGGGVFLATEVEVKPNGKALFEGDVKSLTDSAEAEYRRAGMMYQQDDKGRAQSIGRLDDSGPEVERVRGIIDTLIPPYVSPDDVRVYVIRNKEWNAMAMGNYSIYVFSGLLDDLDDDEVALVLGHEIAHATHEHTRKQFKKQMWIQIAALGVSAAAGEIDDKNKRAVAQLLTAFGAMAWSNGYGRGLEDQADRVGMRYAYEGGWDISKAPRLWQRFAKKYGEPGKVASFFFSDHSQSSARATKLEKELAYNYPEGPRTGSTAKTKYMASGGARRGATPATRTPAMDPAPVPGTTRALATTQTTPAGVSAAAPQRAEIKVGMTMDEVRRLLGNPKSDVAFGGANKWAYEGMSIIFEAGRVKEVKF